MQALHLSSEKALLHIQTTAVTNRVSRVRAKESLRALRRSRRIGITRYAVPPVSWETFDLMVHCAVVLSRCLPPYETQNKNLCRKLQVPISLPNVVKEDHVHALRHWTAAQTSVHGRTELLYNVSYGKPHLDQAPLSHPTSSSRVHGLCEAACLRGRLGRRFLLS